MQTKSPVISDRRGNGRYTLKWDKKNRLPKFCLEAIGTQRANFNLFIIEDEL